jgi:hypothetical protein
MGDYYKSLKVYNKLKGLDLDKCILCMFSTRLDEENYMNAYSRRYCVSDLWSYNWWYVCDTVIIHILELNDVFKYRNAQLNMDTFTII